MPTDLIGASTELLQALIRNECPVNGDGWSRDPFGGELIDGEVWGRGALDMLYQTARSASTRIQPTDSMEPTFF